MSAVGKRGVTAVAADEPGTDGLTQSTCVFGLASRPNIAPRGGLRPKLEKAITHPVDDGDEHGGTLREVALVPGAVSGQHLPAEEDRRDEQPPLRRAAVDHRLHQVLEHVGALRVADQDDPAAVVVVGEVVAPGGQHVAVGLVRVRVE